MAEAIFRDMLQQHGINVVRTGSAGIAAFDGMPASTQAITVCRQNGLDISRHRSRLLTPDLAEHVDIILTMTGSQWYEVTEFVPEEKAFLLSGFGRKNNTGRDIRDPFGGTVDTYTRSFQEIHTEIERAFLHILQFLNINHEPT